VSFSETDPKNNLLFPRHGWLTAVNGYRFLRLPIMRLYQIGEPTHQRCVQHKISGVWLQCISPYRTLRHLAVALRDLHREILVQVPLLQDDWMEKAPSLERDAATTRMHEGNESIEISLIAIFILLRRLADELINASAPFLFEHYKSAPRKMSAAIARAKEGGLEKLKPICDLEILTNALLNHTSWLAQLRKHGIRDVLVHDPHLLQVGGSGTKRADETETSWRVTASLITPNTNSVQSKELLSELRTCIAGACSFMELLYACVGSMDGYTQNDCLFLTGMDNDAVGFWPAITAETVHFPLAF